jgi:fluoride ion exporter CrcB/FEX
LPLGTFTCNMAACVVDYVLLATGVASSLTPSVKSTLHGIQDGGMGSLSTVSTWANEARCRCNFVAKHVQIITRLTPSSRAHCCVDMRCTVCTLAYPAAAM